MKRLAFFTLMLAAILGQGCVKPALVPTPTPVPSPKAAPPVPPPNIPLPTPVQPAK